MLIADHDIYDFFKKNLLVQNFFIIFFEFGSLVFLEIAYSDSLQQYLTSGRGNLGSKLDFLLFSQVWFISFPLE